MKHIIATLMLLITVSSAAMAQRVSRQYNNVSFSSALKDLNGMQKKYVINFVYDELEDFKVTTTIRDKSVPDAIRQMIGFYPIRMTLIDNVIAVESTQKASTKMIGRVVDKHGAPIEFANVALLSERDSSLITGGVTNASGTFVIPCEARRAIVRVSFVGYNTYYKLYSAGKVGSIIMSEDAAMLKEIVVEGSRPMHQMTPDGIVTYVSGTVLSKLGTANDVLKFVPGLRKTSQGFEVFGKGQPLIYLNGRKVTNLTEIDRLSAESIKTITLVRNPGAEYDATVGAIIKIKTLPKAGDGFGGSYGQTAGMAHYFTHSEQLDLNYRTGGLDLFGGLYFSQWGSKQRQNGSDNINLNTPMRIDNRLNIYSKGRYINGNLGFNYDINGKHYVGATYTIDSPIRSGGWWTSAMNIYKGGQMAEQLINHFDMQTKCYPNHDIKAYYSGALGQVQLDWDANIYLAKNNNSQQSDETDLLSSDERKVSSDYHSRSRLYASKLAATFPALKGQMTIGSEYTDIERKSAYTVAGSTALPLHNADDKTTEWNLAGFLSYGVSIDKVRLNAGLRFEHVAFKYYNDGNFVEEQSRTYNNLFPNVSIAFPAGRVNINLAYTAKTRRPNYSMLSSNVQYNDRYTYQSGNPVLQPSQTHTIELNVSYKWVQLSANWRYYRNSFFQYVEPYEEDENITVYTFRNLGHSQSCYAGLTLSPAVKFWKPMLVVEARKQFFHVSSDAARMTFDRPLFFLTFNNAFDLPHGFVATINMDYTSRGHSSAILWGSTGGIDLGLSKSLLKGDLTLNLQLSDLLHTRRNVTWLEYGNREMYKWNKTDSRQLMLSARYKINVAKSKYRGTGAGNEERNRL